MTRCSLQKEANLIKQKYMTQETDAQNIKNQLKPSTDNETTEELKNKPIRGQFYRNLERPSVYKEISLAGFRYERRNGKCNMSCSKSTTQNVLLSDEHHQANN